MAALIAVQASMATRRRVEMEAAIALMRRSGFAEPARLSGCGHEFILFPRIGATRPLLHRSDDGAFIGAAGTVFLGGTADDAALPAILDHLRRDTGQPPAGLVGHFIIVACWNGGGIILRDANSAYEAYSAHDGGVVSTSFAALAAFLSATTIDRQSCYEYVFDGVTLGDGTVLSGVRKLGLGESLRLSPDGARRAVARTDLPPISRLPFADAIGQAADTLLGILRTASDAHRGPLRMALSGGYDSRLLVAALRRLGKVPDLYVYGDHDSSDVLVAKAIAAGETLELTHINKDQDPEPDPDEFPALVERNYLAGDALPWGGIFNRGAEHRARALRHAGDALLLNGGAGEIMRNFFKLPDRGVRPLELAQAFYAQFDPRICREPFDRRTHLARIADKIRALDFAEGEVLTRQAAEAVYPHFRCRSWNGRESNANGRFGRWLLPFYEGAFTSMALAIPPEMKADGRFEAALIATLDPALSRYPSNYGHRFDELPSKIIRLYNRIEEYQPPWLRQYRYGMKWRLRKPAPFTKWLGSEFAGRTIDGELPYMSRLFRIDEVRDEAQMARILTLEYFLQRNNVHFDA